MSTKKHKNPRTAAVQAGIGADPAYHAVIPPLYTSSTFEMAGLDADGVKKGSQEAAKGGALRGKTKYEYSRTRNPTRDLLAEAVSELEGGYGGHITSSGMAAITLILHLLNPDDLLIAPYDCYGREYRLLCALSEKGHFKVKFIDMYSESAIEAAFSSLPSSRGSTTGPHEPGKDPAVKPRDDEDGSAEERSAKTMILIETPSNPVMRIADIAALCARAKEMGALVVCDNTFLSPSLQKPLELGADIVFHSTTKFLNGHSDVVGGAVVAKTQELWTELDFWANSLGVIGAPFDAHMTLRGLRTLDLRVKQAQESARAIAAMLEAHPKVRRVYYPGLESHAGYEVAQRQQDGPGAMLSLELEGELSAAQRFIEGLEIFRLAQSLGGTESLINHPASMTHVSMGPEARAEAGVTDTLLRLSVGIEDTDDLIEDLKGALERL